MLDPMRLQFDMAALVARQEDGVLTIKEDEYAAFSGKVIACTVDSVERTVSYFVEDYDEEKHGGGDDTYVDTDVTEDNAVNVAADVAEVA